MKTWFKARIAWSGAFQALSDAEAGRLAKALWHYAATGEQVNLTGAEKSCYAMFICTLQADEEKDREISETRKAAANNRWKQDDSEAMQMHANECKSTVCNAKNAKACIKNKNKSKNENKSESKSENQREILTTTTARAREEIETPFGDVEVDPLVVKCQQELLGLTQTHYEQLGDYRDELGDELVSHAIDVAVANGVRTWAYVVAILQAYIRDGVRTVGDAKARDERRQQQKQSGGRRNVSAQQYGQRDYSERDLDRSSGGLLDEALLEDDA